MQGSNLCSWDDGPGGSLPIGIWDAGPGTPSSIRIWDDEAWMEWMMYQV